MKTMGAKGELTPRLTIGFRCLPNYGNDLRMQYNRVLSELAGSNLLANIVSQLVGKPITVRKYGDLSNAILESNYALS